MKNIWKKATFWFAVVAVLVIINNMLGNDDKNIILIGLNPILSSMPLDFMNSGPKFDVINRVRDLSIYWYIGSLLTMMSYGAVIDILIGLNQKSES